MKKKSLLVFSTAIISGVSIFINKFGVQGMDSSVFTFAKNITVGIFLFSLILIISKFNEFNQLKKHDWLKLIVIGLIGGSIPFLLFFRGLQITSGASASLIHKSMFIFVMILAMVFLKEKLNKKVILASGLLILGNFLLLKPSLSFNFGDLLVLSATLFWAAENTLSKYTLKDISSNMVAFGRMFFGSSFILVYLIAIGKAPLILQFNIDQISWILITSGMLFMYVLTWYNGLKHVNVSMATAILLLGAPITTLLNFLSGTPLNIDQALGILLLVIGVITFINSVQYVELTWTQKTKA